ncbi:hypothetical protein M885DRAFT_577541 [Pelagophyceae sp. CCMP2097]|nr:hypothetical protein M885DRAFT_577541 [Pelagophyceae sp. CCMP2097]
MPALSDFDVDGVRIDGDAFHVSAHVMAKFGIGVEVCDDETRANMLFTAAQLCILAAHTES